MSGYRKQINQEYEGILPMHEAFYLLLLGQACSKALEHYHRFENAISKDEKGLPQVYELFSAVSHAGNISTFFWPNPRNKQAIPRSEKLKNAFPKVDLSVLKLRDFRNSIAHIDERIDSFCDLDPIGPISFGYVGKIPEEAFDEQGIVLAVDPDLKRAKLFGSVLDYGQLFIAISELSREVEKRGVGRL